MDLSALAGATWADLTEDQPEVTKTPIESAPLEALPKMHQHWREHGFVAIEGLIPNDVLDRYSAARAELPKDRGALDNFWNGWHYPTPYMNCKELLDVATYHGLSHVLNSLIGDVVGVHLALTGWVSTERNWHQDTYLNPDYLWSHYLAAWIALDDVSLDSGPFEFVDGSHNWPALRRDRLFRYLSAEQRQSSDWPTFTQGHVARVCEEEMERRGVKISKYVPKKGDVLIWHSNLLHRGSAPTNPDALRKSLICHYSAVTRRLDMDRLRRNPDNGILYFDLPTDGAVRPLAMK